MATRKRRLPFAIETLRHYQTIQFVSMEETERAVSSTLTLLLFYVLKGYHYKRLCYKENTFKLFLLSRSK